MSSDVRFVWGIHGLVGHGKVPSDTCSEFRRFDGCLGGLGGVRHDVVDVYGHNFHGKGAFQNVFMRCYSARCPKCFHKGWAVREADKCAGRLFEASKGFGLVEHGTISLREDVGLLLLRMGVKDFKAFWRYIDGILVSLGVVGGLSIFHPARYVPERGWYWSPHWHFDGFIVPSYGRCRRCKLKDCRGKRGEYKRCDGFDAKARRENAVSGLIIKVFGRRSKEWVEYVYEGEVVRVFGAVDNVRGTISYELGHAGLLVDSKRANVVHWFGVCAPRKMKFTAERRRRLCPICASEFVHVRCLRDDAPRPVGSRVHIFDLFGCDGKPFYVEMFGVG